MTSLIASLLIAAIPTILAITLHEAAHGYAAWALGDDTAKQAGRLSLNPLVHVDRVGTILLPAFLLISQLLTIGRVAFMFGWAKPVPVAAWRFANPRRGMMIVAAAGPAMNFLLAWIGMLSLYVVPLLPGSLLSGGLSFVTYFLLANIVLGVFNLLPVPPLDGGRIVVGLLPERAAIAWAKLERAGIALVLIGVFILPTVLREFGILFDPVRFLLGASIAPVLRVLLALSGHPMLGTALLGGNV